MERMPSEMWMRIFDNLEKSNDTENAYRTCKIWKDILNPIKASWMFDPAIPFLLEHLSKRDILNCRLVCKQWRSGVDKFLENNLYHRPALKDVGQADVYNTDFRDDALDRFFHKNGLDYNHGWSDVSRREETIKEAQGHSGCPIVGKSIFIYEQDENPTNTAFLETIGRYVWFLKLKLEMPPIQALKRLLQILSLVPNIKTLQVIGRLVGCREDSQRLQKFAQEYRGRNNENFPNPPKVKTLKMCLFPTYLNEFKVCLLLCISPEHLKCLHTSLTVKFPLMEFENLAVLSLVLNSGHVFHYLLQLKSPICRLSLELREHVNTSKLFDVVKHFSLTLRNFELKLLPDYYLDCDFPYNNFHQRVESFASREILNEMRQLKRVTLKGCIPPSINFLSGVRQSLEYLHLPLHMYSESHCKVEKIVDSLHYVEDIDVIEKTRRYNDGDKLPVTYDSNVWSLFPKLKMLTMYWNNRDVGNRREAYEKFKNNSTN